MQLILIITLLISHALYADSSAKFDFKPGVYSANSKENGCEETILKWEKEMLIFGNHRFSDFNKEEVKFSGAGSDEKDRQCDLFWKAFTEGKNKVVVIDTTKCPSGSKYDSTQISKQAITQIGNKIIYEASVSKNGEIVGTSRCEYQLKKPATAKKK